MIKFQQSQALTSHFESFWSVVIVALIVGISNTRLIGLCLILQKVFILEEMGLE